jgi:hypothetical protein
LLGGDPVFEPRDGSDRVIQNPRRGRGSDLTSLISSGWRSWPSHPAEPPSIPPPPRTAQNPNSASCRLL